MDRYKVLCPQKNVRRTFIKVVRGSYFPISTLIGTTTNTITIPLLLLLPPRLFLLILTSYNVNVYHTTGSNDYGPPSYNKPKTPY